jgi:hypothetical protein
LSWQAADMCVQTHNWVSMTHSFFTVGHSTRTFDEFVEPLQM